MRPFIACLFSLCLVASLHAQTSVTLAWNAEPMSVSGYKVLYGTKTGQYTITTDVGAVTQTTIASLQANTAYYFAVVAYAGSLTSPLSAEVSIPGQAPPDPNCIFPLGADVVQIFPTNLGFTGSGGAGSQAHLDFQLSSPNSPVTSVAIQSNGVTLPYQTGLAQMTGAALTSLGSMWFTLPTMTGTYPLSVTVTNLYGCTRTQPTSYTITIP